MSNYNSNSHTTSTAGGGITITGLLQLAFIILKLCNVIDWPWFWVLFPIILGASIIALAWLIFGIIFLGYFISEKKGAKRDAKRKKQEDYDRLKFLANAQSKRVAERKRQELYEKKLLEDKGVAFTVSYEDLQNPNLPHINEWLYKMTERYQLDYRYEMRSINAIVGGKVVRTGVTVLCFNKQFQQQERTTNLGGEDVIRLFPSKEKEHIITIESKDKVNGETYIRTLIFDKDEDLSFKIK